MIWWKKLYGSLFQWKVLFWKNPEKVFVIGWNSDAYKHFLIFQDSIIFILWYFKSQLLFINAITSLNYYTIWMFILLLLIVFLTWRWVSEYIMSCQSSKPLPWYQKLCLRLYSPQQLCSMELWPSGRTQRSEKAIHLQRPLNCN